MKFHRICRQDDRTVVGRRVGILEGVKEETRITKERVFC